MRKLMIGAAVIAAWAVGLAPSAQAEPDNIYGLITPDEQQEIWDNGWRNCVTLDQSADANPPVTSQQVIGIIENYRSNGWDLESAGDIVWESVEGRCPEYMDQVKRAMRSYGPMD